MWTHWTAWYFCQSTESKTFTLQDVFRQRSETQNTYQSKRGFIFLKASTWSFPLLFYSSKAPLHSNNSAVCCTYCAVIYYEWSVVGVQADRWPRSETQPAPPPYYAAGADISWLKAQQAVPPGGRPPSLTVCHTQTNPVSLSVVPIRKRKVTL